MQYRIIKTTDRKYENVVIDITDSFNVGDTVVIKGIELDLERVIDLGDGLIKLVDTNYHVVLFSMEG